VKKVHLWVWRSVIASFVLLLLPISLWYFIAACAIVFGGDYKYSNALPIPFVPEVLSAALGLVLMTWGMVALWWLVFQHERLSIRQIALPWRVGLFGGTSIAVYWLIKWSASNGENDQFVFIPSLVFGIVLEVMLLARMCFNSARTPLEPRASDLTENQSR
jgi:hypothetical protein